MASPSTPSHLNASSSSAGSLSIRWSRASRLRQVVELLRGAVQIAAIGADFAQVSAGICTQSARPHPHGNERSEGKAYSFGPWAHRSRSGSRPRRTARRRRRRRPRRCWTRGCRWPGRAVSGQGRPEHGSEPGRDSRGTLGAGPGRAGRSSFGGRTAGTAARWSTGPWRAEAWQRCSGAWAWRRRKASCKMRTLTRTSRNTSATV